MSRQPFPKQSLAGDADRKGQAQNRDMHTRQVLGQSSQTTHLWREGVAALAAVPSGGRGWR